MGRKKATLFLYVSLAFFIISIIAFAICEFISYNKFQADFPNDTAALENYVFGMIVNSWIVIPVLGNELSFIRSMYKMLKKNPRGCVKAVYIISSVLAFSACVFYCIYALGWINFVGSDGMHYGWYIFFYTEWPVFIVTVILGSIPIKVKTPRSNIN